MKIFSVILTLITGLLFSTPLLAAQNEYEVAFGDYTINYSAFPSEMLEPNVAKAVNISRASYRGVVTIAVRKRAPGGKENAAAAKVNGHVTNLIGQRPKLDFSEVKDGKALYYVSDFTIPRSGNKLLTFNITVRPDGESQSQTIEFKRQY